VHNLHAAAHVKHFTDSQARDKLNSVDKSSGVERSPDKGVESISDPNGIDTSAKDLSSVDRTSQS
jgi:hypothetical protein